MDCPVVPRGRTVHIQAGEQVDSNRLWTPEQELEMTGAFEKTGFGNLTGAKELLGDFYDYGQLRLFRAVHEHKCL